jgi:hypothetical protein
MKYRVTNTGPAVSFHPEEQPSVTIPHTATSDGVTLELPDELVQTLTRRDGNHPGISLARVGEHQASHEAEQQTGIRVIVKDRLDWPQLGFELKAGVTHADSLDAWTASIPPAVRPKLAPFVRSHDVRLLDLATNPHADLGETATAGLEAP